jgi:hypothetical protein
MDVDCQHHTEHINTLKTAVPLQAWSGPQGSTKLRFPDFLTTAHVPSHFKHSLKLWQVSLNIVAMEVQRYVPFTLFLAYA